MIDASRLNGQFDDDTLDIWIRWILLLLEEMQFSVAGGRLKS